MWVRREERLPLKRLLEDRRPLVGVGAFNALTAKLIERAGFDLVYLSGAGLANSWSALPDIGLLTLTEVVQQTRWMARSTRLPVIVDADTGFGEAINVARAVCELEEAGAQAIQLEDQQFPKRCGHLKGKSLVPPEVMEEKIRSACEARQSKDFLIIARTDARTVTGFQNALSRAQRYAESGADLIFPEALASLNEFQTFVNEVPAPILANMTEFGQTPYHSVKDFAEVGVAIVLFPVTLLRVALYALQRSLEILKKEGTQASLLDQMLTRQELYDLLGYKDYERFDHKVSGWRTLSPEKHPEEHL